VFGSGDLVFLDETVYESLRGCDVVKVRIELVIVGNGDAAASAAGEDARAARVGCEFVCGDDCLHDVVSLLVVKIDFLVREGAEFRSLAHILPPTRRTAVPTRGPGENVYRPCPSNFDLDDIDPLQELFADFGVGRLCLCLHGVISACGEVNRDLPGSRALGRAGEPRG